MVLRDIETDEMIVPPYFVLIRVDELTKKDRNVYLNFENFNWRMNEYMENPHGRGIFMQCTLELINEEGRKEVIKPQWIPKEFFPKTFEYFQNMEKILLN